MPGCHGAAFSASGAQAEGPFREDGYFNMTRAAKHYGKRAAHFLELPSTKSYIKALQRAIGLSDVCLTKGGWHLNAEVGTWGHPRLAVVFGRWLDDDFAVWCDMQIDDILRGRSSVVPVYQAQSAPAVNRHYGASERSHRLRHLLWRSALPPPDHQQEAQPVPLRVHRRPYELFSVVG